MRPQRSSSQDRPRLTSWRLSVPTPGAKNPDSLARDHWRRVPELRVELRSRDPGVGASFLDAGRGDAQVVAVLQGLVDQPLQRLVLEDLPPRPVGERGGLRRSRLAAHLAGRRDRGTLVVRSHCARRQGRATAEEWIAPARFPVPHAPSPEAPHLKSPGAESCSTTEGGRCPEWKKAVRFSTFSWNTSR